VWDRAKALVGFCDINVDRVFVSWSDRLVESALR